MFENTNGELSYISSEDASNLNSNSLMSNRSRLILKNNDVYKFINSKDIIFLTRSNRKTLILTKYSKYYINDTLDCMSNKLGNSFFRSHKSFLINISLISEIYLLGGKTFEIKFLYTTEKALITLDNFKKLSNLYL